MNPASSTSITPGTVLALVALFFALGGSAFAVSERLQSPSVAQQRCTNGAVRGVGREGLYDFDTRLLSRLVYRLGDEASTLAGSAVAGPHRWRARLHSWSPARQPGIAGPALPQDSLDLDIDRAVGPGLLDRLTVSNCSAVRVRTRLRVDLEPDFSDVLEIGRARRQQGEIEQASGPDGVTWRYRARAGSRHAGHFDHLHARHARDAYRLAHLAIAVRLDAERADGGSDDAFLRPGRRRAHQAEHERDHMLSSRHAPPSLPGS